MVKKWLAGAAVSGVILCAGTGMNAQAVYADEVDLTSSQVEETAVVEEDTEEAVEVSSVSDSANENTAEASEEQTESSEEAEDSSAEQTEAEEASEESADSAAEETTEEADAESSSEERAGEASSDTENLAESPDTEKSSDTASETSTQEEIAEETDTTEEAEEAVEEETEDTDESEFTSYSLSSLLGDSDIVVSTDATLNVQLKAAVLTALATTSTTEETSSILDDICTSEISLMDADLAYAKVMESYTINGEYWAHYNVWMQGSTSISDERFIFALINDAENGDSRVTLLYEYNRLTDTLTLKKSDTSYGHCNNLTYDSKNNEIMILMGNDTGEQQQIVILDADTFEEKDSKYLTYANSGEWIVYDEDDDYYLVRDSKNIIVLDNKLNRLRTFSAPYFSRISSEYAGVIRPQGLAYGNGYVFISDGIYEGSEDESDWYKNIIRMYSLATGELIETYLVDDIRGEIEDLSYDGTNLIVGFMSGPKMPGFDTNKFGTGHYVAQFYAVDIFGFAAEKAAEEEKAAAENTQTATETALAASYGISNLSLIYDYDYYVSKYSNLLSKIQNDRTAVLKYFLKYGMAAQHQAIATFDPVSYRYANQDLRIAFRTDYAEYYRHYINFGKKEGRSATGVTTLKNAVTKQNGVNYASVYNYHYYTTKYQEVLEACGDDDIAVLAYFVKYGMPAQQQAIATFDPVSYRYANQDLRIAFRSDYASYYTHYITFGKNEGRTTTGVTSLRNPVTKKNGVSYASVYGYYYYTANNSYVANTYGEDDVAVLDYFVNTGMKNQDQAIATFNVSYYRNKYSDLRSAFGTGYAAYYLHYINFGRKEGRIAYPIVDAANNTYDGVNYSLVYDFEEYLSLNPSVASTYGTTADTATKTAVLTHFVTVGMAQKLQGISTFDVTTYAAAYSDLRKAFGSDYPSYYLHYILYGYKEGRTQVTKTSSSDNSNSSSDTLITRSNLASILANPIIPDISHWKPVQDWDWVENNVAFIITKATQGTSYVDSTLKSFITECESRGIPYWLYAYLEDGDELAQTKFLVETCSSLVGKYFVGYVLDVEENNDATSVSNALSYLNTQSAKTMIYTGWSYYQYKSAYKTLLNNLSSSTAWWESRYGLNDGEYPDQTKYPIHSGVDLHQYTSAGYTKGISSSTDLNKVVGSKSLEWFMNLA